MIDPNDLAHVQRLGLDPVASCPCPVGGIGVINPHVTRFALKDGRWTDVFHVKPVYYETPAGEWRPLSEIAAHHGNRRIVLRTDAWGRVSLRFLRWLMARQRLLGGSLEFEGLLSPERLEFAATLTAYPDPDPETTTVDGYVINNTGAWATIHDAATGSSASPSTTTIDIRSQDAFGGSLFIIYRGFTLFDTSALGAGATAVSGVASLYSTAKTNTDNDGDDWLNVVQSSPASNTGLTTDDFDQCGAVSNPTEGATRIDIGSVSTSAYNDWTLDGTGNGWISLTGVTKLGWREGHDAINVQVANGTNNLVTVSSADNTGTTQDPKLVVTYTPDTSVNVALTGAAITSARGSFSVDASVPMTGAAITSARGSFTPTLALALTGSSITSARGSFTPGFTFALTGTALTASLGAFSSGLTIALTGTSGTALAGSLAASMGFTLTGFSITATPGEFDPQGWTTPTADSQSWTPVSDTHTWTAVSPDSQNWTPIGNG